MAGRRVSQFGVCESIPASETGQKEAHMSRGVLASGRAHRSRKISELGRLPFLV